MAATPRLARSTVYARLIILVAFAFSYYSRLDRRLDEMHAKD
jgi:hypothetical protein